MEEEITGRGTITGGAGQAYAMGSGEAETERLIRQSDLYAPFTRRLLGEAGVGPGMRVLDVGSGAGDVALMAAGMVGPSGSVVGVDRDPGVLEAARARALQAGLENVTFVEGELDLLEPDGAFDAAVGRLVLMHQKDPAVTLRSVAARVRGGGVVAFQEFNCTARAMTMSPPTPLWEEALGRIARALELGGVEIEMGFKLRGAFLGAGLPEPKTEMNVPVGGGPAWRGPEYAAETLRTLLPLLDAFGVATPEEVGVDTLAERLRDELVASGGMGKPPEMVSAWARKP